MPTFVITGNYTPGAMKGMLVKPSDREAAVRPLIEAAGGKVHNFLLTTGDTDFLLIAEMPDGKDVIAPLLVTGSTGTVSHLRTVRAFSSAEFMESQKRAAELAANYKPPN